MAAKIKPVPGYRAQPGPGGPGLSVPKAVTPKAIVVKKPAVPKPAIGMAGLGIQPGYTGQAAAAAMPVAPWAAPTAPGDATSVPRSAAPGNYLASLADIQSNPLYEQALGSYNTNMQSLMKALQGNFGQAVIKSGYDPTAAFQQLMKDRPDLGEFANLLDPTAATAAGVNPLSERAMNEQTYNRGMENQSYELAARGIGQSGAAATGTNALLQSKQLAENQSRTALLEALQSGITGYLGQKTQGYDRVQDVAAQVAELLANQEGAVYDEGDQTPTDEIAANPSTVPGTAIPSAANTNYLPWFGKKIANVTQMRQELASRGLNWNTWAIQHPDAVKKLLALS